MPGKARETDQTVPLGECRICVELHDEGVGDHGASSSVDRRVLLCPAGDEGGRRKERGGGDEGGEPHRALTRAWEMGEEWKEERQKANECV